MLLENYENWFHEFFILIALDIIFGSKKVLFKLNKNSIYKFFKQKKFMTLTCRAQKDKANKIWFTIFGLS